MKIKNKIIQSTDISFFENELNKLYNEYNYANIEIQFCPLVTNNKITYTALVIVKEEVE